MTAIKSRKPSAKWMSLGCLVLFIAASVFVGLFVWLRDRQARLRSVLISEYTICGDNLYTSGNSFPGDRPTIRAQSIHGGEFRVICQEAAHYQFCSPRWSKPLSFVDGNLYYAIQPSQPFVSEGGTGVDTNVTSVLVLGTFRLTSKPSPAVGALERRRTSSRHIPPTPLAIRIRRLVLKEGVPQDVMIVYGKNACLVGDHLFWISPAAEETVTMEQKKADGKRLQWWETSATSDLMLTSLTDRTTRCIRHGVPADTNFVEGNAGVSWFEPGAYPHRLTLYYARVFDGAVYEHGTISSKNTLQHYVEFKNRLYWASPNSGYSVPMSCNLDGSDVREVRAPGDRYRMSNQMCTVHNGSLYFEVFEGSETQTGRAFAFPELCRFHPERTDPIEIVCDLPGGNCQFDGNYLYFVQGQRSLWAAITNGDNGTPPPPLLCRVPLNH